MQFIATATTRTLELLRLRRSHIKGVGWMPVYESAEIIYYQKNGVVLKIKLGCWSRRPSRYGRLETVSFAAKLLRSRHWVTPMDDLFGEAEWKVVITHCVNEAHKTDWAAWVSQLGDDHFREGTEPLATAILGALTRMGIFEN